MQKTKHFHLDILQYAKQGRRVHKELLSSDIPKLQDLVLNTHLPLAVSLDFSTNDRGFPVVHGQVVGNLKLTCQRCIQAMDFPLEVQIALVLLAEDQVAQEYKFELESYVYESAQVSLADLISDDIILSLPLIARHPEPDCSIQMPAELAGAKADSSQVLSQDSAVSNEKHNPFSVLKELYKTE